MRTKALLSVAAIAASAISAMAQTSVYSLNIVGYATVTVPSGYSILANPLSAGATNGANEIGLQIDGEQILTWNGTKFNFVSYDATLGWLDSSFAPSAPPSLPPGVGFFFYNPGAGATNITFVGQVVPGPSSTNTLSLASGYSLVGSPLPANVPDITTNPVSLPKLDGMQVLTWDNATSKYIFSAYDATLGWLDAGFNPKSAPSYSIGQGFFFYNPQATSANWAQSLP
ncbi:MAG TPA: hypothetical protein VKY92_15455 [Verrucomicrobiae bacterium]|nr:hypothetical protein [Verrucomicrobiae bacterium]